MPVHRVTKNNQPGYQWGQAGKIYTYKAGNAVSRKRAKQKAINQGLKVAYVTRTKPEL